MPRKVKPRWGWEHTHDGADMSCRVANLDWDWLGAELGGDTPEKASLIERELLASLGPFYGEQFDDPSPTFEEIKAALGEIADVAQQLAVLFKLLDTRSRSWLAGGFQELSEATPAPYGENDLDESAKQFLKHFSKNGDAGIIRNVEILCAAIAAINFPVEKKSRGPKPKTPIKHLVFRVSELLREQTERNPLEDFHYDAMDERYEGKLVRVLEHIFDRFVPDLELSNAAIGEQIRRTIGDRSRS